MPQRNSVPLGTGFQRYCQAVRAANASRRSTHNRNGHGESRTIDITSSRIGVKNQKMPRCQLRLASTDQKGSGVPRNREETAAKANPARCERRQYCENLVMAKSCRVIGAS